MTNHQFIELCHAERAQSWQHHGFAGVTAAPPAWTTVIQHGVLAGANQHRKSLPNIELRDAKLTDRQWRFARQQHHRE